MKKLLLTFVTLAAFAFQTQAETFATNILSGGTYILSTNRASIYQVELTSANACLVNFYDSDSLAAPFFGTNYVAGAFVSRTTFPTNIVSSYVGSNGFTNWYTNAGVFSLNVTNTQSTNQLPLMGAFVVAAGTYAVYNTDQLHVRGVTITTTTNVSIVVNYRKAQ
jgi:hypothetical protein